MAKEDKIEVEGQVLEPLPNAQFIVTLQGENWEGKEITAHLAGKMKMNHIRILPGDRVTVELSLCDPTKGRFTYRHKH